LPSAAPWLPELDNRDVGAHLLESPPQGVLPGDGRHVGSPIVGDADLLLAQQHPLVQLKLLGALGPGGGAHLHGKQAGCLDAIVDGLVMMLATATLLAALVPVLGLGVAVLVVGVPHAEQAEVQPHQLGHPGLHEQLGEFRAHVQAVPLLTAGVPHPAGESSLAAVPGAAAGAAAGGLLAHCIHCRLLRSLLLLLITLLLVGVLPVRLVMAQAINGNLAGHH
jgi:hypothetical protein